MYMQTLEKITNLSFACNCLIINDEDNKMGGGLKLEKNIFGH